MNLTTAILAAMTLGPQDVPAGSDAFSGQTRTSNHHSYPWKAPTPGEREPDAATLRGSARTEPGIEIEVSPELDDLLRNGSALQSNAPNQAVEYDPDTGKETYLDLDASAALQDIWIQGRSMGADNDEWMMWQDPAFGSDLTSISSQSFPWSAACRILYTDAVTGATVEASGTLIDAKYVITAGFVVHKGNGGNWNSNFRIYPAWDGDSNAFGESGYESAASFTGWTNGGNYGDCMGFIRLSRPVGFLTGWMGYGTGSDSFFLNELFNVAGYPSTCYAGAPDQLYYGWGSYDSVTAKMLNADVGWTCSTGGAGGMGTYWIAASGNRYVMGTHVTRCTGCNPNTIGHSRLTSGKWNYFHNTFRPGGYPTTNPDYVPLNVQMGPADVDVTAGHEITQLTYLVANSSLDNPVGSQNYNVDVYLSTNDNISTFDTLIGSHSFSWDFGALTSVRVTATSPPTIPANTPSGDYWVGVIVTGANDASSANDDTDGWDAVPITVTGCEVSFDQIGQGLAGSGQFVPVLFGSGSACQAGQYSVTISNALGGASGLLWVGVDQTVINPFFGGTFYVDLSPPRFTIPLKLNGGVGVPGAGFITLPGADAAGYQGLTVYVQGTFFDPGAVEGISLTNALEVKIDEV